MRSGRSQPVDNPAFGHIMFMSRTRVKKDEAKA
jgi:hypothetical protein